MPIYAYRCAACGHAKDVLQKMSDAPLTTCPACGAEAFSKQVTAAGFQLKGSGWYVTDFRGGSGASAGTSVAGGTAASAGTAAADSGTHSGASNSASTDTSGASGGSTPAAGCGSSCACH
ncbi:MAG: zinc ribbon domain-containing protein [Proteobacteria bacterium]|uniref:FmdB family zinc ribbon protein n=1 Tax=Aquabacterium sp. TaxID=1872578 RepID=UPI0035C6E6D5|nr:zinc ribbon domain-containing protein [Pseudomonadota bacterium]